MNKRLFIFASSALNAALIFEMLRLRHYLRMTHETNEARQKTLDVYKEVAEERMETIKKLVANMHDPDALQKVIEELEFERVIRRGGLGDLEGKDD